MSKKVISIVAATTLVLSSFSAMAEENGGGCGVGKMVMEGKDGKNAQVSVALINWVINFIAPVQLFAMTSGTLGCDVTQQVKNDVQPETFFAQNSDSLSIEIAQGEGDHLTSLAVMMGIPDESHPAFFSLLQDNYDKIAASDNKLASIDTAMLSDVRFEKYVR